MLTALVDIFFFFFFEKSKKDEGYVLKVEETAIIANNIFIL
jgi:hypothetical protein